MQSDIRGGRTTAGDEGGDRADEGALLSVVYASAATQRFSDVDLALLLATSRSNNEAVGITGVLLHSDGRFMQALEGPVRAVRATLAVIATDPRHTGVWIIHERRTGSREFGSWAMGYRPLSPAGEPRDTAWLGSPEAVQTRSTTRAAELLAEFRSRIS